MGKKLGKVLFFFFFKKSNCAAPDGQYVNSGSREKSLPHLLITLFWWSAIVSKVIIEFLLVFILSSSFVQEIIVYSKLSFLKTEGDLLA